MQRLAALFNDRSITRFIVLGAAVVATILVPYLLTRSWSAQALEAEQWARHTAEVSDATSQLMFHLRDMEAAAYGTLAGIQAPALRQRYDTSRIAVDPLLARIERMTQDNAEQQVRIGQVKATLEQRLPYLDEALNQTDPAVHASTIGHLERMLDETSVGTVVDALAATEDRLLVERTGQAARQRDHVRRLQTLSMVAQLLLLGTIAWMTEREMRNRRRAEHRSSGADTRSRAIFDSVREPIALLDRNLNVLMHNNAFVELYGEPDAASAGRAFGGLGNGAWQDPMLLQRLTDVVVRDREIWDYEHRQRTVDGVQREVLVNAKRIVLPDDTDNAVLLTVNDVTPQKMAERHALELNRQLEGKVEQISEVNRELEAFSYSVSHDLRAPLRHISGFSEKLRRHLGPQALEDKTAHYLDVIGSSASRMAVLIDDLLLYSRLGRHAIRTHSVDLDRLVREVRDMLTSNPGGSRVEWRVQPLPVVLADETMLRQVWQNLLSNAIKYSSQRDPAIIEVRHRIDGAMHEFSVRDNGVGFDMEYAGKLFGVFQRLHKASEFPGSGIGLANVRRIVTRHGGKVWADAELGKGAIFYFTLPVRQDNTASERDVTTENTR